MSNFSVAAVAESSDVTFEYDSTLGSITIDGTAVASGTTQEVSLTDGAALVAATKSGSTFLGWIDAANGQILSTETSYTLKPSADMTVKAVFVGANSKPHFAVGAATQKSQSSGFLPV